MVRQPIFLFNKPPQYQYVRKFWPIRRPVAVREQMGQLLPRTCRYVGDEKHSNLCLLCRFFCERSHQNRLSTVKATHFHGHYKKNANRPMSKKRPPPRIERALEGPHLQIIDSLIIVAILPFQEADVKNFLRFAILQQPGTPKSGNKSLSFLETPRSGNTAKRLILFGNLIGCPHLLRYAQMWVQRK